MKILILNYEYPPIGGGAGVVSKYHAEGLAARGHQVYVITTWFKGESEFQTDGKLRIIRLKSKRQYIHKSNFTEWLSWIRKSKKFLSAYLEKVSFNYCFAHFALPGGEVARFINLKFGIPYSIISHGQDIPWFFPYQMFKYHLLTYFWIKRICIKADKLILLSDEMKKNADRFMDQYSAKNLIIPNGCDTIKFRPDYQKRSQKLKILFAGRLVEQKDPFTFLKAIQLLNDSEAFPFSVCILGNGPLLKKMQLFCVKNKLDQVVEFKGWISKDEMLEQYQSSHLLIVSSKAEAMSIAALEALSAGIYLISTPVSGNTSMIEEGVNGEFFNFKDYKSLGAKIADFYHLKYLKNYIINENFLNDFRENYDWKNIIGKLENVCKSN